MAQAEFDVLGIGNAIVDVLARSEDAFLGEHGLAKGSMTLIDAAQADALYDRMGPGVEVSGGSVANSIAGVASLGGRAAYIGKVRDDELGRIFAHDIRAAGVAFDTPPAADGPGTARCLILVTPDAQRTMSTYLGACTGLGPEDIDGERVAASAVTYLEGYLWDPPRAKEAFRVAMDAAHAAGRRVALTLSDSFCVERHRDEFLELVDGRVDVLFANEAEIRALYRTDLEAAVAAVRGRCEIAVVTRSAEGCLVVTRDAVAEVPAKRVEHVVDTTGAGDLFAAGFLHGLTRGAPLADCARIGAVAAAEVISHYGARPETPLRDLAGSPAT
ncbi:adenosine kinase [Miltoncostaea marina]|uniref:adenosine kinase n=1 Tax=Miltoncostaea marina TaxID=2843215 RepID=UPI001C3C5494|nr:adenosine kinase [Miltoncostaea marina]